MGTAPSSVSQETSSCTLSEISDFPNHPFKVTVDEKMLEMADSIKRYGVLVPAIVRPKQGGGYEMIAGHRRKAASEIAEKPKHPPSALYSL